LPRRSGRDFYHAPSAAPERFGRALQAICWTRTRRAPAVSNVTYYKSSVCRRCRHHRIAGSLFAHHAHYLNPNDFTFWKSIEVLSWSSSAASASLAGAVVGAFVVTLLPEYLRVLDEYRMAFSARC